MQTVLKAASPLTVLGPGAYWAYNKRQTNLKHPVMERALLHLKKNSNIIDYCGEDLKVGYWISVNQDATDNYIKFNFTIKGTSGDLNTSVIADYLTHRELSILEEERKDYFKQRKALNENADKNSGGYFGSSSKKDENDAVKKELDANYVPIDFDAYSIHDKSMTAAEKEKLEDESKVWRISSLTAAVDADTKILLLPQPEAKRTRKFIDT